MLRQLYGSLRTGIMVLFFISILTGLIYPVLVTSIAQWLFPYEANGSMIAQNGVIVGSNLIGQSFTESRYFLSRPSATDSFPYNAERSGGSNMSAGNPAYLALVKQRVEQLKALDANQHEAIPVDLVTASGSGLDPNISLAAAYYQAARIASVRHVPVDIINGLIERHTIRPTLGFLGEPRVNVLALNISLNQIAP